MLDVYSAFAWSQAALPVFPGRKSRLESFAGADRTYTIEGMMRDGKALQAGTSHNLGTNFAEAFGTRFQDPSGDLKPVHQSSWGVSTRMVGGIIMAHGDDMGLRLPPALAPVQVVFVPVGVTGKRVKPEDAEAVAAALAALRGACAAAGLRAEVDDREGRTPGWKFAYHEMRGVPLRVEVGPRDVGAGEGVAARRDRSALGKEGKLPCPLAPDAFAAWARGQLDEIQAALLADALAFRDANVVDCATREELVAAVADGRWARCGWAGSDEDETAVKEETGATLRCFPLEQPEGGMTCVMTGVAGAEVALFAKAY